MKETPNSWLICQDQYETSKFINKKRANDHDYSSFKVCLCPNCNRVHENAYFAGEGTTTSYYEGFPRYKLKVKVCKRCGKL